MCPKASSIASRLLARQHGFLMPLAMFIVVGAATLAIAMAQMSAGSRSSAVLNALNVQAFYAADAGVQSAMNQMYTGATTRSEVDTHCSNVNGSSLALTSAGLKGCSVSITCESRLSADGAVGVYSVTSISECGSGDYQTGHRVLVEAYMQNQ